MSDAPQDSTATVEQNGLKAGLEWVGKNWGKLRLAHEGVMVDRVQRVQRIGEVLARNTMTGDLANTSGWPGEKEGDPVGVAIGDSITNNHYYPAEQPPKPEPPPIEVVREDQTAVSQKPLGTLAKAAVAAALLGTGVGGGVAVPWLAGMFAAKPPAVDAPADTTRKVIVEKWLPEAE